MRFVKIIRFVLRDIILLVSDCVPFRHIPLPLQSFRQPFELNESSNSGVNTFDFFNSSVVISGTAVVVVFVVVSSVELNHSAGSEVDAFARVSAEIG